MSHNSLHAALTVFAPLQEQGSGTSLAGGLTLYGATNAGDIDVAGPGYGLPSALDFNGSSQYAQRNKPSALTGYPFSMGCWAKADTITGSNVCASIADADDSSRYMAIATTYNTTVPKQGRLFQSQGTYSNAFGTVAADTNWHYISASWKNPFEAFLYVDGVKVANHYPGGAGIDWVANFDTMLIGRLRLVDSALYHNGPLAGVALKAATQWSDAEHAEMAAGPELENTVAPAVSGTETQGQTLSCTTGTWALPSPYTGSNGTPNYVYQWTRSNDGGGSGEADIAGAAASTYTLTGTDVTKYIRCRVRAENTGGFIAAEDTSSNFTGAIAAGGATEFDPATLNLVGQLFAVGPNPSAFDVAVVSLAAQSFTTGPSASTFDGAVVSIAAQSFSVGPNPSVFDAATLALVGQDFTAEASAVEFDPAILTITAGTFSTGPNPTLLEAAVLAAVASTFSTGPNPSTFLPATITISGGSFSVSTPGETPVIVATNYAAPAPQNNYAAPDPSNNFAYANAG